MLFLLELSTTVCAQGTRRRRLHLRGVCDPGCAATREKTQSCPAICQKRASHRYPLPPGSTTFSSEAGHVAHERVGNEMGNERGPGSTRREGISRATSRAAGASGAQGVRVGSGAVTSSRAGGPKGQRGAPSHHVVVIHVLREPKHAGVGRGALSPS